MGGFVEDKKKKIGAALLSIVDTETSDGNVPTDDTRNVIDRARAEEIEISRIDF